MRQNKCQHTYCLVGIPRTENVLTLTFTALVTFKRRRSLKVTAPSSTPLTRPDLSPIHNPPPHLIWGLPLLLRINHLNLPPLHHEVVHLIPSLPSLLGRGILNKGKSLGLLRMKVTRDIHITYFSNPSKCHLKILGGNLSVHIAYEEGDSWRTIITTGGSPPTTIACVWKVTGKSSVTWRRRASLSEEAWWWWAVVAIISSPSTIIRSRSPLRRSMPVTMIPISAITTVVTITVSPTLPTTAPAPRTPRPTPRSPPAPPAAPLITS
mmetsp:Transcript_15956/g.34544  ORF Transcript_15956/g.34544 Transcript_15956/m.34544 type:complete len:266 (+) Transcript_15956:748-1545(+)